MDNQNYIYIMTRGGTTVKGFLKSTLFYIKSENSDPRCWGLYAGTHHSLIDDLIDFYVDEEEAKDDLEKIFNALAAGKAKCDLRQVLRESAEVKG